MKSLVRFLLLLIICAACKNSSKSNNEEALETMSAEKVEVTKAAVEFPIYDYDGLEPLLHMEDSKTYIINFWATWCQPCVKELPYLEKVYAEQKSNGVELVLVSLDMPSMWEKRLVPFVKKNNLKGRVVILDDPNMNDWIPKIDEDWGGGIPATLIYNAHKRVFFERGFTYTELNEELNKFKQ